MSEEARNILAMASQGLSPTYHKDDSDHSPVLERQDAVAGKAPMMDYFMEEDEIEELPDLAEYFDQFTLDYEAQIRICRAYASYLSTLVPPKRKRKKLCE